VGPWLIICRMGRGAVWVVVVITFRDNHELLVVGVEVRVRCASSHRANPYVWRYPLPTKNNGNTQHHEIYKRRRQPASATRQPTPRR